MEGEGLGWLMAADAAGLPAPGRVAAVWQAPTAHPLPLRNGLRDDEVRPSLDRDEVLAQAPASNDGRFAVPAILGEEP